MDHILLRCINLPADQSDIIMALLQDSGANGFEQTEHTLLAYFTEKDFDIDKIHVLQETLQFEFSIEKIEEQNWNATWESNFEPVFIGEDICIRAHFHPAPANKLYDIIITPKMSFGTGHHETTSMMLQHMSEMDLTNKVVFDFGCGTAILSIYASLRGAKNVVAIDNDTWSVENGLENCAQNKCHNITVSDQAIETIPSTFDLIVANINLNILVEHMPILKKCLQRGGDLLLSGILVEDENTMRDCLQNFDLQVVSTKKAGNWLSIHAK
jgi:ribosomal protein L11 methyltransferase